MKSNLNLIKDAKDQALRKSTIINITHDFTSGSFQLQERNKPTKQSNTQGS